MNQQNQEEQRAQKILRQLQTNPELMEQVEGLVALLESETAMGRTADEVEEEIIERLRKLGHDSLQSWVGSGLIESGHRHVLQARLKISSCFPLKIAKNQFFVFILFHTK